MQRKTNQVPEFWQLAVRRLATEINIGWWLSGWLPLASAVGLVGMVLMLYVRWRAAEAAAWVWGGVGAAFVAAGIAAWWNARQRFESEAAARVRLEEALGLQARLTAASAGVGAWPARPSPADKRWPVVWRWRQPLGAIAFIVTMLALAAWVPIAGAVSSHRHAIEKPTDARIVEQWMAELAEEKLVDDRSIEEVARKIQELLERPSQEWYEHASLEAAGTLKEQTAADVRELHDNLAKAEQAAAAMQSLSQAMPQSLRGSLAKELAAAMKSLEEGQFTPAGDLAKLLRELDPADLGRLSPEQIAALTKRLSTNRQTLQAALAQCKGFKLGDLAGWCDECSGCKACGECKDCKSGKPCTKPCKKCGRVAGNIPGRAGTSRGRGDAEMSFGERNDLGTTRVEQIQQEIDAERAAPADVLAVVDGEHEVDEQAYAGPRAGGAVAGNGDGGGAVQVDALLPAEQSAVRRFFE